MDGEDENNDADSDIVGWFIPVLEVDVDPDVGVDGLDEIPFGSMHLPCSKIWPVRHVSHVSLFEHVMHEMSHSKQYLSLPYLPRGHFE